MDSERFFIYGKPKPQNVSPYNIILYSENNPLSSTNNTSLTVIGELFLQILNVYVSGADGMFNNSSFYNPFSGIDNLYPSNPGFNAIIVPEFSIAGDKHITFNLPEYPNFNGFVDIIIENEAGYGKLTTESYKNHISSWSGFQNTQLPCISGVYIKYI